VYRARAFLTGAETAHLLGLCRAMHGLFQRSGVVSGKGGGGRGGRGGRGGKGERGRGGEGGWGRGER
jgi:hypothetical protein